ncbi:MAG: ornithine carbamoyltransferase [Candidatus Omnitrophota bacterium]
MKDLITLKDMNSKQIDELLKLAYKVKAKPAAFSKKLAGKTLGLIFQKPSNRTRVSFEVGIYQLGGYSICLGPDDIKLGVREATEDIARTLSRYLDIIVARTYKHEDIVILAKNSGIPIINGLSDLFHPCQALADVFTIKEKFKDTSDIKVAFVGDGNNVLHSLMICCAKTGISMHIATPRGYEPNSLLLEVASTEARKNGSEIIFTYNKEDALKSADVIYTDVWTSMGSEDEAEKRLEAFKGFQINAKNLALGKPGCIVMHCLPAHRGQEITGEVLDGPNSVVFDQAENRLHVQKAVMLKLLT